MTTTPSSKKIVALDEERARTAARHTVAKLHGGEDTLLLVARANVIAKRMLLLKEHYDELVWRAARTDESETRAREASTSRDDRDVLDTVAKLLHCDRHDQIEKKLRELVHDGYQQPIADDAAEGSFQGGVDIYHRGIFIRVMGSSHEENVRVARRMLRLHLLQQAEYECAE